jgi:hypothetical protein
VGGRPPGKITFPFSIVRQFCKEMQDNVWLLCKVEIILKQRGFSFRKMV